MHAINSKEKPCSWICESNLVNYKEFLKTAEDHSNITESLLDGCAKDIEFAKFVNDPVDKECTNICEKLIPRIVGNEQLKKDLLEDSTTMASMFEFCDNYDYSSK
ncbi:hypothetical protein RB195_005543 [Necator americanus]